VRLVNYIINVQTYMTEFPMRYINNEHTYIYIEHVELTRDATCKKKHENVRSEGSFA